MSSYQKLEDHFREIANFEHASGILDWDNAAMMPSGSADVRAAATASLSVHIHKLSTDSRIPDWVGEAKGEQLDEWQVANVREIERGFTMNAAIPADLVEALSTAASNGEQAWRSMREKNNWQDFKPYLDEIFKLSREQGQALGDASGKSPYDALISIYQQGIETKDIDPIFTDLKAFLPDVVQAVVERQNMAGNLVTIPRGISIEKQRALGLATMETLGFDFNRGRLDVSHHPFCGGAAGDVRLTTRYDEDSFLDSLQGVIHETGHALYEQNRPQAYLGQPVSEAMGMAMHESQSLFMEMQLGRGAEFIAYLAPLIRQQLAPAASPDDKRWSSETLYAISTHVEPGLIRVHADECTYPAHVILRYEMEQQLIAGSMSVADIPDAWDASMQALLGLSTTGDYKDGCMQDVHWPSAGVGYFPTYTLGAIAAAQMKAALLRAAPDIDTQIARGDLSTTMNWLRDNIWSQGSLYGMQELMTNATGKALDVSDFKSHLKARYLGE
ncbi:MAG: carboxypeptidase M32 [Proteobacteria bacterium]|nr:carboxypeptidase M32 [Pseudomonadota bacterium]